MTAGAFKEVNGLRWPYSDVDCAAVVFGMIEDLHLALRYVKNFDTCVQAGGNCGVWPLALGERFSSVISLEADFDNYDCLVYNTRLHTNIVSLHAALGADTSRFVEMEYPEGRRNMGAARVKMKEAGDIPIMTIDDLNLRACDFIQLDIEGFEPFAIQGGVETIKRFHPVLMIEDKGLSEHYGYPENWSDEMLAPFGYTRAKRINRDNVFLWRG